MRAFGRHVGVDQVADAAGQRVGQLRTKSTWIENFFEPLDSCARAESTLVSEASTRRHHRRGLGLGRDRRAGGDRDDRARQAHVFGAEP